MLSMVFWQNVQSRLGLSNDSCSLDLKTLVFNDFKDLLNKMSEHLQPVTVIVYFLCYESPQRGKTYMRCGFALRSH